MSLTFEPEGHIYKWDGRPVYSVTQILSQWIEIKYGSAWFFYHVPTGAMVPGPVFIAARDHGNDCHRIFQYTVLGLGVDRFVLDPALLPELDNVMQWAEFYQPEVLLCEEPMYHPLGFAGTPDLIFKSKRLKDVCLVDAKGGMPGPVAEQTAAYLELWRKKDGYRGLIDRYCFEITKGMKGFYKVGVATDFMRFTLRLKLFKMEGRAA